MYPKKFSFHGPRDDFFKMFGISRVEFFMSLASMTWHGITFLVRRPRREPDVLSFDGRCIPLYFMYSRLCLLDMGYG